MNLAQVADRAFSPGGRSHLVMSLGANPDREALAPQGQRAWRGPGVEGAFMGEMLTLAGMCEFVAYSTLPVMGKHSRIYIHPWW